MKMLVLILLLVGMPLIAQEKKPELPPAATVAGPELTDQQKLTVQNFVLKITSGRSAIENAQLRIALLQADLDKTQTEAGQYVQTLQKECFDLDLDKMTYTAKKDCKPKAVK